MPDARLTTRLPVLVRVASFLGVIEKDIRSYPSSMPSTHRANMMGRSRPQESQQTEGLIKVLVACCVQANPSSYIFVVLFVVLFDLMAS